MTAKASTDIYYLTYKYLHSDKETRKVLSGLYTFVEAFDKKQYHRTGDGNILAIAAGNLGGQFFGAPDYPFFQGGLSIGHAFTFGRIAGKHAASL